MSVNERRQNFSMTLQPSLVEKIDALRGHRESRSQLVEDILRKYVESKTKTETEGG